jgi:hypothetical protein
MSKEKNTTNSIDSNDRKAMLYNFASFSTEKLQESSMHIGIKKAVNSTSKILNPSKPNVIFMLEKLIQEMS